MNVDGEDLKKEVTQWKKSDKMSQDLCNLLFQIANKVINKSSWNRYTWKDEMIDDALFRCLKYGKNCKLNSTNSNVYSYFYRIIENSYIDFIKKQNQNKEIEDKIDDTSIVSSDKAINYSLCIFSDKSIELKDILDKKYDIPEIKYKYDGDISKLDNLNNVSIKDIEYYFWLLHVWMTVCNLSYRQIESRTGIKKSTLQKIIKKNYVSLKTLFSTYYQLIEKFQPVTLKKLPNLIKLEKSNLAFAGHPKG